MITEFKFIKSKCLKKKMHRLRSDWIESRFYPQWLPSIREYVTSAKQLDALLIVRKFVGSTNVLICALVMHDSEHDVLMHSDSNDLRVVKRAAKYTLFHLIY